MANLSERDAVRPLHTEHIHVEKRRKAPWLLLLLALLATGLLAVKLLAFPAQQTTVTTTTEVVTTTTQVVPRPITYANKQWEAKGATETFPGGEIKLVGKSQQGDLLYFNPSSGYKTGEGSEAIANTISTPSGRVYLKSTDGRFQPLFVKP